MITFYSKIDSWLIITFIFGSIILSMCPIIYHRKKNVSLTQSYFLLFLPIAFVLLMIWLPVFNTSYQLTQTDLIIHNGFTKTVIPRKTIVDIKPSHSLMASPALSLDRLEITYRTSPNKAESILISPKNIDDFIQQLKQP